MKLRPKSKLSQWNAGEVLQAIPKIQFILEATPTKIKYRSLSLSYYLSPQSPNSPSKLSHLLSPEKDFQYKTQDNPLHLPRPLNTSFKLSRKKPSSTVSIDQHTQIDNIVVTPGHKSVKPRRTYEIPVIKLEKNLPNKNKSEAKQVAQRKPKKTEKPEKLKNLNEKKAFQRIPNRRGKLNTIDEAVGNDFLASQSSGIFSQSSLLNKYLTVYQNDLNNY